MLFLKFVLVCLERRLDKGFEASSSAIIWRGLLLPPEAPYLLMASIRAMSLFCGDKFPLVSALLKVVL